MLVEDFTPRELEVIKLLAQGLSNKSMSDALQLSEHTVKYHVANIAKKIGVNRRMEIVLVAMKEGWV